jgi:hypothetical protein
VTAGPRQAPDPASECTLFNLDSASKRDWVDVTPASHANRAMYLSNLGGSLAARFERTGDVANLDAAIRVAQDAVDATPTDRPDRAGNPSNLGIALSTRFQRAGDVADLDAALDCWRRASAAETGTPSTPSTRLDAARA